MNKKIQLVLCLMILMYSLTFSLYLVSAFSIDVEQVYWNEGKIVQNYGQRQFDGISFKIFGDNELNYSRIVKMQINGTPIQLEESLPDETNSLRIKQEKLLWETEIINLDDLSQITNFTFLATGYNEEKDKLLSANTSMSLEIETIKDEDFMKVIGNKLWPGKPFLGWLIVVVIGISIIFTLWKHNVSTKAEHWKERKEKQRQNDYEMEEGY